MTYASSTAGAPPYPEPVAAPRNGLGTAALVVGIVALVTSFTVVGGIVLGVVALVLGVIGRGRAKRGEATNRGMATAGVVLGLVGIVLSAALVVGGVSLFHHFGGQTLVKCLNTAGHDQAKVAQCQQQFKSKLGS